jgi:hypothetical protein
MSTKTHEQIKEARIQRLLEGTVPGKRYRAAELQRRTGWSFATTGVVIGYATARGLLRSEGLLGKRCFLRTIPSETSAGDHAPRATLEHYEKTWRTFESLCMATRRR